jgi:hypothetical protein
VVKFVGIHVLDFSAVSDALYQLAQRIGVERVTMLGEKPKYSTQSIVRGDKPSAVLWFLKPGIALLNNNQLDGVWFMKKSSIFKNLSISHHWANQKTIARRAMVTG